ncbi:DUF2332 domain-containing protein [Demequina muriae]|uniref:DUF2332 domain-containing protein n=1 Tax=Demequina muriae TaxID=3051664 RepID=A0ABT8GG44_9MICO|nr:DUF2332 domain-containing protein [Demequina sp. EGI L300058]MDN4480419.1 DUF2332 domain-containing protein [Demequina sp. EGI L300058]
MATFDWARRDREDLAQVAAVVRAWMDYAAEAPLYRALAGAIADDEEMLRLVARIDNVPPLNLLFAGVKLMLRTDDALAAWYPHLVAGEARSPDGAFAAFREYALAHEEALVRIGRERRTQTNEVARAAVLLPWLPRTEAPLHAIDIGASAGLNLCLDRFAYRYRRDGDATRLGDGPLLLDCEDRGGFALPPEPPRLASRTGIDLHPIDPADPDAAAWLEALVWPDHQDRLERLRHALELRRSVGVRMVAGDAATVLADVERAMPPGPLAVWHTIALYQADEGARVDIDAAVEDAARRRDVTRVGFEPVEESLHPVVRVGPSFDHAETVAVAHSHARWIDRPPF